MNLAHSAASLIAQTVNNTGGGGGFLMGIPCIGGLIGLACLVLWIWALIDAIGNSRLEGSQRIVWVLVIIFVPLIGPILYLLIGRKT